MLNTSLLNQNNYAHVGSYPANGSKDLIIPQRAELSDTMLVRWTIHQVAKDVDFTTLNSGLLISEIEVEGYGVLESQTFDIPPSKFNNKRVQLINLDLAVPQKLTFTTQNSGVLNSTLEFYAYIGAEEQVYQTYHTEYMPSSNPVTLDPAAITQALVAAAPALAQSNASANLATMITADAVELAAESARSSKIDVMNARGWTGEAKNHVILKPDLTRLKAQIFNQGNQVLYVAIGDPDGKEFKSFVDVMQPGGSYIVPKEDRFLGLLIYSAAGKPDSQIGISQSIA